MCLVCIVCVVAYHDGQDLHEPIGASPKGQDADTASVDHDDHDGHSVGTMSVGDSASPTSAASSVGASAPAVQPQVKAGAEAVSAV